MELNELSHLIHRFEQMRTDRLAMDKVAAELKKRESEMQRQIVAAMINDGVHSVGGDTHRVTLQTSLVPKATDWDAIRAYVEHSGNWQLIGKRLVAKSYLELASEGEIVPGVESVEINKLSVSKL